MKKILGLTSIRSDYDLMSEVYRCLDNDPDIDLRLLVSGAHLSPAFGLTVDLIRQDGFTILSEAETLISGDTKSSRLKTASGLLSSAIDIVCSYVPDLIIYAGDREDVLIDSMIGAFLGIPTVHFFGGDHASDGHVDNPVRHATSKLSTAHFVSHEEHRKRLLKIGEYPERIFVIGSVALDKFVSETSIPKTTLLDRIRAKNHAKDHPMAILIFHPVDQEKDVVATYARNATNLLIAKGFHIFIGVPNSDPGNSDLADALNELDLLAEVTYYRTTTRSLFVNLMRHASVMVGNSSAGILEAASTKLPVINIGERQRDRLSSSNVLFTDGNVESIRKAIDTICSPKFKAELATMKNPYGDGSSAATAARLLKNTDFQKILKKSEDPLYVAI